VDIAKTTIGQIGTEPSDNQYLVVDIGLAVGHFVFVISVILMLAVQAVPILLIGNTAPHSTLSKRKPTRQL
jgi:hypothetical protein